MKIQIAAWLCFYVLQISASPPMPPLNEPRFIGVPIFGPNWITDANTSSTRAWQFGCCSPIDGGQTAFTSLSIPGPGVSSSLWVNVTNHFWTNGMPVQHSLRFRWGASMTSGNNVIFYINGSPYTNTSFASKWTDVKLLIPPLDGATLQFKWTARDNSTFAEGDLVDLDAVKWIPIFPVPINYIETNFMISVNTSNTFLIKWATNYQGYVLTSKTNIESPTWIVEPGVVVFTNNMFRTIVTNSLPRKFFRLRFP
jgi:hypothetical protein